MESKIVTIKKGSYIGYIWYSNKEMPCIYGVGNPFQIDNDTELIPTIPFIVEACLYDNKQELSYSIRYADGKYICKEYCLKSIQDNERDLSVKYIDREYIGNKMEDRVLCFKERYTSEKGNDLVCSFDVLAPDALIFVGFKE